jgi:uncharacterized membrane protein
MTTTSDMDETGGGAVDHHDSLSKHGARAVMFVLLLAVLMALSAIFLILGSEGRTTAAAERLSDVGIGASAMPE